MTTRRVLTAFVLLLVLGCVSTAALVVGFFTGATYQLTREAGTDALVTASVLVRLRDGRHDEGIRMLETTLEGDLISHWSGFSLEDSAPEIWVFRRLNLSGLSFAASYLSEHQDAAERSESVQEIIDCYLQPNLPDPRDEMILHRKAISSCYDGLR